MFSLFILDFDVKSVLTARTYYGMLATLLRQTKVAFARGAFLIYVGLLVTLLAPLQILKALQLVNNFDDPLVFLLPFVNIF